MQHIFYRPKEPTTRAFRAKKNDFPKHLCGLFLSVIFVLLLISIRCEYVKNPGYTYESVRAYLEFHPEKPWTIFTYIFALNNPNVYLFGLLINLLTLYWLCAISAEIFSYRQLLLQSIVITLLTGVLLYVYFYNTKGEAPYAMLPLQVLGWSYLVVSAIYAPHHPVGLLTFRFPLYRLVLMLFMIFLGALIAPKMHLVDIISVCISICYGVLLRVLRRNRPRVRRLKFVGGNAKKERQGTTAGPASTLDAILKKVSQQGYQALTPQEKRILYESSR